MMPAKSAKPPKENDVDDGLVRSCAAQHGLAVAPRGRVAAQVLNRYKTATSGTPAVASIA